MITEKVINEPTSGSINRNGNKNDDRNRKPLPKTFNLKELDTVVL